jgi:hypothetical protein
MAKAREVDDLASKLDDQIRKLVDAPGMFSGVTNPGAQVRTGNRSALSETERLREDARMADRQDMPALYAPAGATWTALVADVPIKDSSEHMLGILAALEGDYPELAFEKIRTKGEVSGRALRAAREPAESKVIERRAGYDHTAVRAMQGLIAIAGFRGYEGYEGYGLDSYARGDLDHRIGERPVFSVDPLDELDEAALFWANAKIAKESGYPLELYLSDAGWAPERMATVLAVLDERRAQAAAIAQPRNGGTDNEAVQV